MRAAAAALALALAAGAARAEGPPNAVLFDLQAPQVEAGLAAQLSARLRERVAASPGYRPQPRAQVELRLLGAPFDDSGQCGAPCQARARDLLAAEWILDGAVLRSGGGCAVRLRLTDTINGGTRQQEAAGRCEAAALGRALDEAWGKLRGAAAPSPGEAAPPPPSPFAQGPSDIGAVIGRPNGATSARRAGPVRAAVAAQASGPGARAAEAALRNALQDQQVEVVDADPSAVHAAGAAKKLSKSAEFLVRVRVTTTTGPGFGGSALVPQLATLEWDVVSTTSGRVVRSGIADGKFPHIDATQGGAKAAAAAAQRAAPEIARVLAGGAP